MSRSILVVALLLVVSSINAGDVYSVSILGDMHYDAAPREKFHSKAITLWEANDWKHPGRLREFDRNAKMWQDGCKRILDASSKCVRPDAAFMLQLGDLVQGDCEDNNLHRQMLSEATGLLTNAYHGLPVVTVCGNHDIRQGHNDRGAWKAYADYITAFETDQLKGLLPAGVKTTTFGFRYGKDLWIFLDFNFGTRDTCIVKKLLEDNQDVRYTFVCTHGPVLPMQVWRKRWIYLGKAEEDAVRREMRGLFAKRNAIVLAGHVHTLEKTVWEGDGGRITEMVMNTCAMRSNGTANPVTPNVLRDSVKQYGEFSDDEKGEAEREIVGALYDEYRAGIRELYNARAAGHHILRVTDNSVELDYYGLDAVAPTKTFILR